VYRACSTAAATPIPAAESSSSANNRAGKPREFDRRPRARFGAVETR
jgi:hypothetical protein